MVIDGVSSRRYGQFMRGLSGGIGVLAMAGFFWLAVAGWAADCRRIGAPPWTKEYVPAHYSIWAWWVAFGGMVVLLLGAWRVRRKATAFRSSETLQATDSDRRMTRRIVRTFLLVAIAEGGMCWLSAVLAMNYHRQDLLWPGMSVAVSLHFIPLGRLFRMPPYYVTGTLGAAFSLLTILPPQQALTGSTRLMLLGAAMAPIMWITALYVIRNSDELAQRWICESAP